MLKEMLQCSDDELDRLLNIDYEIWADKFEELMPEQEPTLIETLHREIALQAVLSLSEYQKTHREILMRNIQNDMDARRSKLSRDQLFSDRKYNLCKDFYEILDKNEWSPDMSYEFVDEGIVSIEHLTLYQLFMTEELEYIKENYGVEFIHMT